MDTTLTYGTPVAQASVDTRATFITRTYLHVVGALLGFTLIEVFLFKSGLAVPIAEALLGVSWLFVLGGFIVVVGWLAVRRTRPRRRLRSMQPWWVLS